MDSRLRTATRIHYLLARQLGEGIDIGAMLKREDYAREVLFVCEASDDPELHRLAAQFRSAPPLDTSLAMRPAAAHTAAAPLDTSWGRDSSGFGVSRPPLPEPLGSPRAASRRDVRWYQPSTWFANLDS